MKTLLQIHRTASLLLGTGLLALGAMLWAAPGGSDGGTPYNDQRDFSQPHREAVVGTRITADRSFFGAPPPMPHTFVLSERNADYCLQCHAKENRVAKRHQAIAPVPHQEFSQCMQCHVRVVDPKLPLFRANEFVGLDYPGKGLRAHDYAPPTVPHKTFMRENCLSCHGPTGNFAIKSPHPIRSQCRQCHAPEALMDYTRPVER